MLCLSLMENSIEKNLAAFKKYQKIIDIVELRLDMLEDPLKIPPVNIRQIFSVPIIITFRRDIDGGNFEGSEKYRKSVLSEFAKVKFDYIDLEIDTCFTDVESRALSLGIQIIRSYHNFKNVPANLESIIRLLSSKSGEIPKAAVFPANSTETLKLFKVIDNVKDIKQKIIIGMGEYGIPSRLLYRKLGSMLSFCSIKDKSAAPGQLSPEEMAYLYHVKKISKSTLVFGIIGNPVMHSLSPELHNSAYQRAGIDAVYVPFPVDNLNAFFRLAELLNISGFSVTIPHKIEILDFLDVKSPEINSIKSCNTVCKEGNLWKGYNTDFNGFLSPLLALIDKLNLEKCAVIGAGGAARAVISALQGLNLKVTLFNRSRDNGIKLAMETGSSFYPLSNIQGLNEFRLIVQTTSVGMYPFVDKTPVPDYHFHEGQIVYDIIYNPEKTKLLIDAEKGGAIIINGLQMLKAQGSIQFEIFTGQPFPTEEQKENS